MDADDARQHGEEHEHAADRESMEAESADNDAPGTRGAAEPEDPDADPEMQRQGDSRTQPQPDGEDFEDPDADPEMLR